MKNSGDAALPENVLLFLFRFDFRFPVSAFRYSRFRHRRNACPVSERGRFHYARGLAKIVSPSRRRRDRDQSASREVDHVEAVLVTITVLPASRSLKSRSIASGCRSSGVRRRLIEDVEADPAGG
jgi:hypothetical protein